jgi:hypothetical protein
LIPPYKDPNSPKYNPEWDQQVKAKKTAKNTAHITNKLSARLYPDIDLTLHCEAVRINDELRLLLATEDWQAGDIIKLKELTNLILLIKKTAPHLQESKKPATPPPTDITE